MISYAQNFEDVMLERVFRGIDKGFYIDVGAADPINLSVTKWFYDKGWSGINIEPVREFHDKLVLARPRDINLNCGAGATRGEANFREDTVREWSTFALDTRSSEGASPQEIHHQTVPIRTLNDIIEQYAAGVDIHFLKIDVEGWEENVLAGIDLQKHRPIVIVVETVDRDSTEDTSAPIERLLRGANYLSVYFDGLNRFYLKGECESLRQSFASPPNVFDDFKVYREAEQETVIEMLRSEVGQVGTDLSARNEQVDILSEMARTAEAKRIEADTERDKLAQQHAIAQAERDHALSELAAIRKRPIKHLAKFAYKNARRAAARLLGKT